jgi:uncharacterized protein YacL
MDIEQLVIVAVLLVLLGEVTYLVAKLPRQTNSKKRMIFVDTSVLIDGRIIPVAASGFIGDIIAIPRSVIGELQFLADNADPEKRSRARHGLDIVQELQKLEGIDVQIFQDGSKAEEGVDERLLNLAKKHGGAICTIDYNLNKVAVVEGITVCNLNELAKNLRMAYLPGEKIMLEMVQKGQDSHQAVGYLTDGTMVVVEHASGQIGQTLEVEFIRSLQTAAGKMMFARKTSDHSQKQPLQRPPQKPKQQRAANSGTKPQPPRQATEQVQQTQKPAEKPVQRIQKPAQKPTQNRNRRKSADRESALIDLVEKQQ